MPNFSKFQQILQVFDQDFENLNQIFYSECKKKLSEIFHKANQSSKDLPRDNFITPAEAASKQFVTGGQGFQKCKFPTSQCKTKRCCCLKENGLYGNFDATYVM